MSCLRAPGPPEDGPHPWQFRSITTTSSGLLGLSPGPPLPGMASLGSAGGLRASARAHLPGPSTLPLAHSSNCDRHFCMFICSGFNPEMVAALMTKVTDMA